MSYESKMSNPATGRMFDELAQLIRETIEIPNAMLPEDMRNERDGGRSLEELELIIAQREDTLSEHQKEKQEKARRVEIYRKQVEQLGEVNWQFENPEFELDYEPESDKLYNNQLAFVGAMVKEGLIDLDE